jgi:hypothetical protein|tara:strand:- start:1268 stop:1504 length:237 start_codon:yes stop_codon:yes gene_type:complete
MRKHGTINGVNYQTEGFCIKNHAFRYRLVFDGDGSTVYVLTMKELRSKIKDLTGEYDDEKEIPVPVQSMQSIREARDQ